MDEILKEIGENKVTQVIQTNKYEQSIDYDYNVDHTNAFYEDLFKKRMKTVSSTNSINSNSSEEVIYYRDDPFFYLMLYIKMPSISVCPKDIIKRKLEEFKSELRNNEKNFDIKKINKKQKMDLYKLLSNETALDHIEPCLLTFFSFVLKMNIMFVLKNKLHQEILCNEDSFDTIVVLNTDNKYRLAFVNEKYIMRYDDAKKYIFDNRYMDINYIEHCGMNDLKHIAESLEIPLYKEENDKKKKLLKEELKTRIIESLTQQ